MDNMYKVINIDTKLIHSETELYKSVILFHRLFFAHGRCL